MPRRAAEELVAQFRDRGRDRGGLAALDSTSPSARRAPAASPIANTWAPAGGVAPLRVERARACAVGSGRSPSGRRPASAPRPVPPSAPRRRSRPASPTSSTRVTAAGRCAGVVEGKTASATPAAVVAGSEPPTRVVLLVAKDGIAELFGGLGGGGLDLLGGFAGRRAAGAGAGSLELLFEPPPPRIAATRKTIATATSPAIRLQRRGDRLAPALRRRLLRRVRRSRLRAWRAAPVRLGAAGTSALIGRFPGTSGNATRGAMAGWSANLPATG